MKKPIKQITRKNWVDYRFKTQEIDYRKNAAKSPTLDKQNSPNI